MMPASARRYGLCVPFALFVCLGCFAACGESEGEPPTASGAAGSGIGGSPQGAGAGGVTSGGSGGGSGSGTAGGGGGGENEPAFCPEASPRTEAKINVVQQVGQAEQKAFSLAFFPLVSIVDPGTTCVERVEEACLVTICLRPLSAAPPACSVERKTPVDAGTITIAGSLSTRTLSFLPNAEEPGYPKDFAELIFAGGDTVTVSATGAKVPAFTTSVVAPVAVTFPTLTKNMAIPRGEDFVFTWEGDAVAPVMLGFSSTEAQKDPDALKQTSVRCSFQGPAMKGKVPGSALTDLPPGKVTFGVTQAAASLVAAGDWDVTLSVFANTLEYGAILELPARPARRGAAALSYEQMNRTIHPLWLGRRRYGDVLALQERLLDDVQRGVRGNTLLLLEHEPVVTFGRLVKEDDLRVTKDLLATLGVELFETGRGGNATYHGPGQLVGYPIFDLNPDRCDVRRYVRDLAQVMIRLLAEHRIAAGMLHGAYLGVWADPTSPGTFADEAPGLAKVGAIGVRLSRFCTMHGFALNVTTDLEAFSRVIWPCGIADKGITSFAALSPEGAVLPTTQALAGRAAALFGEVFDWPARALDDASELSLELV